MHAHIDWESSDCDGRMSGSNVMEMIDEEMSSDMGDLYFQYRVLASVANVGAIHGILTVDETDDGTPHFVWSETTEEGGRSVEAVFYADGCHESHASTRRDHQAEAAGY